MTPINRNISLRGLRIFCVAAEQASFRDAADKLFITASAVSHQIKNLEEELGQKLFERTSRSLTLTEAGRSLLNDVKPLITRLDEVASRHRMYIEHLGAAVLRERGLHPETAGIHARSSGH